MTIEFGWTIPTGSARMPGRGLDAYLPHLQRVIETIRADLHSLWLPDHFMDGQSDVLEALTTLSFLAGSFPGLHLGTIVLGQSYRNPALLAKMAATLQVLSGGRFILGLGAGWKEDEYHAYGYDFPPLPVRMAQMTEAIQICRAMWDPAQPEASFAGEHYQISNAVCNPKPPAPPPIMIGGGGEKRTLRIVAEHADWWNLVGVTPQTYAHKIGVLERHCAAIGRDPASIRKTWMGVVSIARTHAQAQAQMAGYPIWPEDTPLLGAPHEVAAQIQAFIALGVDLFQLAFVDEPEGAGMELFLAEVLPVARGA